MANTLAYGFVGLENLFAQRVDDNNVEVVYDAVAQSVSEHNRQVEELLGELVQKTTKYSMRFKEPGSGTLQPLDEYGNPLPVREAGFYDVAWPIQGGGTAWGNNRVTRALMTVEEVNEHTLNSLQRDSDWMRRHILAAALDNTSWSYTDPDKGALTVQPLANGDSTVYVRNNGSAATDDHYYAQAASIADGASPFTALHTELTEHPSNKGSEIVAYVASDLVASIQGLTAFNPVEDPDISKGSGSDVLIASTRAGMGDELLGKVEKVWIVEWAAVPSGYGLVVARGSSKPALAMREYAAAELQGFFEEEHSADGNTKEQRFIRYAGFGAMNRVAAAAMYIGGASYVIPTAFATPLAV
jgi:hypothetical protein